MRVFSAEEETNMAIVNPQTFFRFAADHHELLVELYQHRDGITEAELLQLVRRFAGEGSPSASYVVDRLRELGFIDYAPQATAQYEMTRPFAELMSSLLREYRLTSVEVSRTNMEPVLVRAINPVFCSRNGMPCDLLAATNQTGAACLILEWGRFWSLTASIAIVENLECFLHFEKMSVAADVALYASGRLSELALQWLGSPSLSLCQFIHCGDYDPVGLDEFLRLKRVVGDRGRLHIPANLRELVAMYGRPELLCDSAAILKRLRASADPDVLRVVEILDETGCGLEQEVLLIT